MDRALLPSFSPSAVRVGTPVRRRAARLPISRGYKACAAWHLGTTTTGTAAGTTGTAWRTGHLFTDAKPKFTTPAFGHRRSEPEAF